MNPYFLMALLYFSLAVLAAASSALTGLEVLPAFAGLRWLRIHFITLGALTETLIGLLPAVAAARWRLPKPALRWDTWLALNSGLVILLVGIPLYNGPLIVAGGTLIFSAVVLLIGQLSQTHSRSGASGSSLSTGRKFYIAGLSISVRPSCGQASSPAHSRGH